MPDNTTFNEVNKLIWPEWTIESLIGEGSFGKVYKAKRDEFGVLSYSAIKMISIPQNESEIQAARAEGMDEASLKTYFQGFVADWVSEIKLMESLKTTQNIVSIEDYKITERTDSIGWDIAIRMELLTSLNNYITVSRLTKRQVMQMGIDICKALEYCQKLNIVHRDIKPENIFVSRYGEFKLGDFGIARQIEKTSSGMSKKGTFTYMAPEVYKGDAYNSTVDIYSLGIVLYRFLNNNRTPFLPAYPQPVAFSDRERANMKRMTGENIPKPANADGRLAEIVLRACAFNPKERYDRPADMREALEAILYTESEAVLIYPAGDALQNTPVKSAGGSIVNSGKVESAPQPQADNTGEKTEGLFTAYTGAANITADDEITESVFGLSQGDTSEGTTVSSVNMTNGYTMQSQNTVGPVSSQNPLPMNGQSMQQAKSSYDNRIASGNNNNNPRTSEKKKSKKIWFLIIASPILVLVLVYLVINFVGLFDQDLYSYNGETTLQTTAEETVNVSAIAVASVGDIVTFGKYEQDNDISNGKEPIQWRVLAIANGKAFLLSEKILDSKPYNAEDKQVTWETCTLRTWLNNDFYKAAFSSAEKSKISTSIVINEARTGNGAPAGNTTSDKLFLLSISEVINPAYGFSPNLEEPGTALLAQGTEYAKSQRLYISGGNSYWWLRTPGTNQNHACIVIYDGSVYYYYNVSNPSVGVRPALWLNLSS